MSGTPWIIEADRLRDRVRDAYSLAATHPEERMPFPLGAQFAQSVGYPIEDLPLGISDVFTGVSNVSLWAPIHRGMSILDLGCGGGLDTVIAAQRTDETGQVIGLDFSREMLTRARKAVSRMQSGSLVQAAAESIPLADRSVDLALVNGIFNLNPRRREIFAELARVVRPSGMVAGAELVLREPLADAGPASADNWFS